MPSTGTDSYTQHFEDSDEVWPCRCGETHRGDYGFYDAYHDECFHEHGLIFLDGPELRDIIDSHNNVTQGVLAYCPACGRNWVVCDVP